MCNRDFFWCYGFLGKEMGWDYGFFFHGDLKFFLFHTDQYWKNYADKVVPKEKWAAI